MGRNTQDRQRNKVVNFVEEKSHQLNGLTPTMKRDEICKTGKSIIARNKGRMATHERNTSTMKVSS